MTAGAWDEAEDQASVQFYPYFHLDQRLRIAGLGWEFVIVNVVSFCGPCIKKEKIKEVAAEALVI